MSNTVRESATEAASNMPTDWAALGARILAAASQAAAVHVAQAAKLKTQNRWSAYGFDRDVAGKPWAEPNR